MGLGLDDVEVALILLLILLLLVLLLRVLPPKPRLLRLLRRALLPPCRLLAQRLGEREKAGMGARGGG